IPVKTKQAQLVETVEQHVPAQVTLDLAPDLFPGGVVTKVTLPQALLLVGPDLSHGARLLAVVPAEACEESQQAPEAKALLVGAQDEIPIDGEAEALIERTDAVPHTAAPEHGFLRDVIHPHDGAAVVVRQHAASRLHAGAIDEDAVAVDDIDFRMF